MPKRFGWVREKEQSYGYQVPGHVGMKRNVKIRQTGKEQSEYKVFLAWGYVLQRGNKEGGMKTSHLRKETRGSRQANRHL